MSKISDLMDAIRRVIFGNDRSDTPQLRKIAATYAGACQEVAAKLEECRALIAAGLLVDAKSIHASMTPPLAERAKQLALNDEEREAWAMLCRFYNYPEAPVFDRETVQKLCGEIGEEGRDSGRLIMRWRKIARSGSTREKIELLRAIIRAVPENSAIWRDNLRQVEQQFVAELMRAVPEVIRGNDPHKIMKLFDALSDPELSVKVPDEVFDRLRPLVNMIQREEIASKIQNGLKRITAAYSAMDEVGLREALAAYDELASHPLHEADMEESRQIREVRNYLEECRIRAENLKKSERETAELVQLLNDRGSLDRINTLYESLKQLGLPLARNLAERVENRREDDRMEAERRYRRRTLVTILFAIFLLAAGALAVVALNMYSENKNTALAWEKQLEEGNPAAVLERAEALGKEKPRLMQFGRLRKLEMEARRLEEERLANETRVKTLLEEAELLQTADNVDIEELARHVEALEKLPENSLNPENEKRLRRLTSALHALEFEARKQAEGQFTRDFEALSARLSELENALGTADCDVQNAGAQAQQIFGEMKLLLEGGANVSEKMLGARKSAWEARCGSFEKLLADTRAKRELTAKLTLPESFSEYCAALEALPVTMPQAAVGAWKQALADLPTVRALALSGSYGSRWESRDKFDDRAREIQAFCRTSPFVEDVRMLLPQRFSEQLLRQRADFDKVFAGVPECYELVLEDAEHRRYYFYAPEVPRREKKRSNSMPKSISMDILYKAGSAETVPLILRVLVQEDDSVLLKPFNFKAFPLPEEFTRAVNMSPADALFPKASGETFLADFNVDLKNAATPEMLEKSVLKALKMLAEKPDMNLWVRASLMRNLLDFLPLASSFYADLTIPTAARIDYWALGHYNQWSMPAAEAEFAARKELNAFLSALDVNKFQIYRELENDIFRTALERGVAPAGVVWVEDGGAAKIHWFKGSTHCVEVWLPVPENAAKTVQFESWARSELKDDCILPPAMAKKVTQGAVVFAPFDGQDTAELAETFAAKARQAGVEKLAWPMSWPVNHRAEAVHE